MELDTVSVKATTTGASWLCWDWRRHGGTRRVSNYARWHTWMGDMLLDIVAWMSSLSPMWAYSIILCVAWLENVVPPIPGDMVVVIRGIHGWAYTS